MLRVKTQLTTHAGQSGTTTWQVCTALYVLCTPCRAFWGSLQSASIKIFSLARDDYLFVGLRSKEENMRELVRLAEVREAQAKEQITALLDNRSNMFQSQAAAPDADAHMTRSEQQIEEAQRTKALAKKKFNKARSVCIAAQQVGWACP